MKSKLDLLSNNKVQLFTFWQEVVTCTTWPFLASDSLPVLLSAILSPQEWHKIRKKLGTLNENKRVPIRCMKIEKWIKRW